MSIRFQFYAFAVVMIFLVACLLVASTTASETVLVASDAANVSDVPDSEVNETVPQEDEEANSSNTSEELIASGAKDLNIKDKTYEIFKKNGFTEPYLLRAGHPDQESKSVKKIELKGKIIPERHPLGHRRYFYRWVLEKADGGRIPLKSNLTLLRKVKNEDLLDGFVSVKGTWIVSPSNKELKFFKADIIRVIDELPNEAVDEKISDNGNEAEEVRKGSDEVNDNTEVQKAR